MADNNNTPGYETRDATLRPLLLFFGGLALTCALIFVAMVGLFRFFAATAPEKGQEPPSPLAEERRLPPLPRLQTNEPRDLADFQREQHALAQSYGWLDKSKGVVRLPLDRARDLVLERGLPTRPPSTHERGEQP